MIKQDFNKDWIVGNAVGAMHAVFFGIEKTSQKVDLPHDAMIFTERSADSPLGPGGAFFQGKNYEYVKKFYVPEGDKGKVFYLEFEGVYMNAYVYVNGGLAGKNPYGYSNFYIQINDYLHYGRDNEVKVIVKNASQPNTRWYSGAGIYRNVKIMKAEPIYIVPDGVRITTVDAEPELALLKIDITLKNENIGLNTGYIYTKIKGADGNIVSEESTKFSIVSGGQISVRQRITLKSPKLWDPDNPSLYTCETAIKVNDKVMDEDVTSFGIRKLQLDSVHGLRINGKTVKLKGGCIHHDSGVIGAATFEDAEDRRIRKLKEAGYNAVRSAHHPMGKALLDACDRHGMLVMDELADSWTLSKADFDHSFEFCEWWEEDVERMVGKDYNHPCVVLYSIGNELVENGSPFGNVLGRKIVNRIHSLDDTRFITNGINILISVMDRLSDSAADQGIENMDAILASGEINEVMSALGSLMAKLSAAGEVKKTVEEACELLDIVGYNYSAGNYIPEHEESSNKIFVGTETNPAALDQNWELVENYGFVLGDFCWTAWDYLGETGIGKISYEGEHQTSVYAQYPWVTADCGNFDITGYRLPISYWREIIWGGRNHVPYIAVQKPEHYGQKVRPNNWKLSDSVSSWTWPGFESKDVIVEVYSDAEEVDLFINGKSQGKKPVGNDFKKFYCTWDTTYEAGTVEAVAYISGKEVGRYSLKTAGAPQLKVTKERESVRAGTNDLCYVNIELMDAEGNLNTADNRKVTVKIEGPATIQGSGTGKGDTEENYYDDTHETFYGRMLAVVRAGAEKGIAKLTVSAEGLDTVTVDIPVV